MNYFGTILEGHEKQPDMFEAVVAPLPRVAFNTAVVVENTRNVVDWIPIPVVILEVRILCWLS